jgi:hypothetical protein
MLFRVKASNDYELPSSLYKTSPKVIWRSWSSWEATHTLKKFSKPPKSSLITSIGFSKNYESISARLGQERVRARCSCLVFGYWVNHRYNLGVPAPWSLGDLPASLRPSGMVWSGDDNFVRGTRRSLLSGKLRNEGGIKVTGKLCMSLSGLAFVACQVLSRKRLSDRKLYSLWVLQQHGLRVA